MVFSESSDKQQSEIRLLPGGIDLSLKQLIVAAALLHLILAASLFIAARTQIAPALIDRDGIMPSFAFDSYEYQRGAAQLSLNLRNGNLKAWLSASESMHVRLISIPFAVLGPLFGNSILSAEPVNLACYLLVLLVVYALGREVGRHQVGVLAAAIVAVWPTFLLHSIQLLKDPLFIAGALAIVFCVTIWLTRTFDRRGAIVTGALTACAVLLLLRVRFTVGILIVAITGLGLLLLLIRQLMERRVLAWNIICALPALIIAAIVIAAAPHHHLGVFKHNSSGELGQLKSLASQGIRVSTTVVYLPQSHRGASRESRLLQRADDIAFRIGSIRSRFAAAYPDAGSMVDREGTFRDLSALVAYLPRAFEIAMWAPFPNSWLSPGHRVGSAGKLLSGGETSLIYVCQLFALIALIRGPRELSLWLLLLVTVLGMAALALIVSNIGALYRFRYTFWILLVVLAAKGFDSWFGAHRRRRQKADPAKGAEDGVSGMRTRLFKSKLMLAMVAPALLSGVCACFAVRSFSIQPRMDANVPAFSSNPRETDQPAVMLTNFTGTAFQAIYLSRSDTVGWEENILGGAELADGDTLDVSFSSQERATSWDLRVEAAGGHYAEWKDINLGEASRITLLLKLAHDPIAVAEVQ